MEIWIVRHADPDYENDSITEKGEREAMLLSERLAKENFKAIYCSPMGRAQKTASYTLKKLNREAVTFDWLHEFRGKINLNGELVACWDRLPNYWTPFEDYYSYDKWIHTDIMDSANTEKQYAKVAKGLDKLIASHGYVHNGRVFDAVNPNHDKILLFCHFGVEAVMLSHLFSASPMIIWHNFAALPTSVTRIVTEEREEGTAVFRCLYFGDISHLYAGGEKPSFQARFCETFTDDTRH